MKIILAEEDIRRIIIRITQKGSMSYPVSMKEVG